MMSSSIPWLEAIKRVGTNILGTEGDGGSVLKSQAIQEQGEKKKKVEYVTS